MNFALEAAAVFGLLYWATRILDGTNVKKAKKRPRHVRQANEAGLMMKVRVRGPRNRGAVETLDIYLGANKALVSSSGQLNRPYEYHFVRILIANNCYRTRYNNCYRTRYSQQAWVWAWTKNTKPPQESNVDPTTL